MKPFFLWLQNLKVTEQYVSKGVSFRWHLVWHFIYDLPDVVRIPFGIEMLKGEYKVMNFQDAAAFSPTHFSLPRVACVE